MLKYLLIILIVVLIFRIIRNFLKGYSSSIKKDYQNKTGNKSSDYKNIEEAVYKEIKDDEKVN
jgi:ATP/ADP translocase